MEKKPPEPALPEAVTALLGPVELYANLDEVALREMSKFRERTNSHGLALHAMRRPPDEDGLLESSGRAVDLPTRVYIQLREALRMQPQILLRGEFGGTLGHRFPVAALFPQEHAALAQAWNALMWRGPDHEGEAPGLTVLHLPDFPQPILLSLPDEGLALILGTDDPRPGLFVALEWANRHWRSRQELIRLKQLPAGTEPTVMLPGGSFLFHQAPEGQAGGEGATALVFPGESVPISWEETLRESLAELGTCGAVDLLLAGAEPWAGEGGGRAAPFWRNALLPVALLRGSERWSEAALHPEALPMGVEVNGAGVIDWEASGEEAFVIVPRGAAPAPFVGGAGPFRPSRHYTHRAMKPEAMDLWALGFPTPEVLGPGGEH